MMKTLAKTNYNDIFASAGRLAMSEGAACRSVIIDSIVRTVLGELQFDTEKGIDYFGTVFRNQRYITIWAGQVRREIMKLDWVKDIENFTYSFTRETGSLNWSLTVNTSYGDTVEADSNGTYLFKDGDGKMGIRWEDIVDKPEGIDVAIERLIALRTEMKKVPKLTEESTLGNTKDTVNKVRNTIVGEE